MSNAVSSDSELTSTARGQGSTEGSPEERRKQFRLVGEETRGEDWVKREEARHRADDWVNSAAAYLEAYVEGGGQDVALFHENRNSWESILEVLAEGLERLADIADRVENRKDVPCEYDEDVEQAAETLGLYSELGEVLGRIAYHFPDVTRIGVSWSGEGKEFGSFRVFIRSEAPASELVQVKEQIREQFYDEISDELYSRLRMWPIPVSKSE